MDKYSPLFYALTWHQEAVADNKNYLSLNLARHFPPNTLLHLAANNFKRDEMIHILREALAIGKINIFVLRGGNLFSVRFFHNSDNQQSSLDLGFVNEYFNFKIYPRD